MDLSAFLSHVSTVVTAVIGWMSDYVDAIVASPVLFTICIAVPLCSMAVNLLNRLIRL